MKMMPKEEKEKRLRERKGRIIAVQLPPKYLTKLREIKAETEFSQSDLVRIALQKVYMNETFQIEDLIKLKNF